MKAEEFQRRYGSKRQIFRNENLSRAQLHRPQPERDQAKPLDQAGAGEAEGLRRTVVRFIGYRVRPLDPDNFAGGCKDLLDGLRHAGLIAGDEPWRIKLETEQVKVSHYFEQKTIIEIEIP